MAPGHCRQARYQKSQNVVFQDKKVKILHFWDFVFGGIFKYSFRCSFQLVVLKRLAGYDSLKSIGITKICFVFLMHSFSITKNKSQFFVNYYRKTTRKDLGILLKLKKNVKLIGNSEFRSTECYGIMFFSWTYLEQCVWPLMRG